MTAIQGFATNLVTLVAIDFSENMTHLAEQQRINKGVDNVRFVRSDLLSFDEGKEYDLIYFSGVLQYIDDDEMVEIVKKGKDMLKPGGVILSRDTIQESKRVILESDYPVIYRTIDEYVGLFERNSLELDYCEMSYPPRRFSHLVSKVYKLPFVSYTSAFRLQSLLVAINNMLGDPRFLMKKHHRDMLDSVGRREHRFFRYRPK